MTKVTPLQVAMAIAKVNRLAGQSYDTEKQQSVAERAKNLLADHKHGAFIIATEDDTGEWAPTSSVVIRMEARGGAGDCHPPLDYYGSGMEHSIEASVYLPSDACIEFVNAAVAAVY